MADERGEVVNDSVSRPSPELERCIEEGVAFWTDPVLRDAGTVIAFSERSGGVSSRPFESLNLAAHVGDSPAHVDCNRSRLLAGLALSRDRQRLTMACQVHGERIREVTSCDAGAGAFAADGRPPLEATDALLTLEHDLPIALCFADCVPVIIVAPRRGVAVVHAGWRGALASLPGKTAKVLAQRAECAPSDLLAYVGAHIGACHYEVGAEIMSQFVNTFGTFARAESGGLDLDAAVAASLESAGVAPCSIARLGTCTAEATDRFFSYRAEGGLTGRHGAVACLLPLDSPA